MATVQAQARLLTSFKIDRKFKLIDTTKLKEVTINYFVRVQTAAELDRRILAGDISFGSVVPSVTANVHYSPADIKQNLDNLSSVFNISMRLPTYVRIDMSKLNLPVTDNTSLSFEMETGFVNDATKGFDPQPIAGQDLFTIRTPKRMGVTNISSAFSPDIFVVITAVFASMETAVFTQTADTFFSRFRGIDKELTVNTFLGASNVIIADYSAELDVVSIIDPPIVGVIKPLSGDLESVASVDDVEYLRIREMNFNSEYTAAFDYQQDTFNSRIRGIEADLTGAFSPTLNVNATFTTEIPFIVEATLDADVIITADYQASLLSEATHEIISRYLFGVASDTSLDSNAQLDSTANFNTAVLQNTSLDVESTMIIDMATKLTFDTTANGTYSPNTYIKPILPIFGIQPEGVTVEWGDGTSTTTTTDGYIQHQYSTSGIYEIRIEGAFDRLGTISGDPNSPSDYNQHCEGFVEFKVWGVHQIKSLNYVIGQWENITNIPNIPRSITNMDRAFAFRSTDSSFINNWDTSNVTSMRSMFANSTGVPDSLSGVDVSNVTDMSYMFYTTLGNRITPFKFVDMTNWDMSSVTNMQGMFQNSAIKGGTEGWNLSSLTSLDNVLDRATAFADNIGTWTITNSLTSMRRFIASADYNTNNEVGIVDLSGWDVSNVTNMEAAFTIAKIDSVAGWDVSNVTNFNNMFGSSSANDIPDVTFFNTISATSMAGMFAAGGGPGFNQDISGWNVSNVTNFAGMFSRNGEFNQDISTWDTSSATRLSNMFGDATSFNQDISTWNTANVTDMNQMFNNATSFNQDLSPWCVEQIPTKPTDFDTGATNWTLPRPNWGAPC